MQIIKMKKRGVSGKVVVTLIVLIALVLIAILWLVIFPIFGGSPQRNIDLSIVTANDFTVYDPDTKLASVEINRGNDNENLVGFDVVFDVNGKKINYKVNSVKVLNPGTSKVYKFDLADYTEPESVSIYPIFGGSGFFGSGGYTGNFIAPFGLTGNVIGATGVVCTTATQCNDNNVCTTDLCSTGRCSYRAYDRVSCDDGFAATSGDVCYLGVCAGKVAYPKGSCTSDADCDDRNVCTYNFCYNSVCDALVDSTPNKVGWRPPSSCNDSNANTLNDRCHFGGVCAGDAVSACSTNAQCNDNNACTVDRCNIERGACTYVPLEYSTPWDATTTLDQRYLIVNGTRCNDIDAHTINDRCHLGGVCAGDLDTTRGTDPDFINACESDINCEGGPGGCILGVCGGPARIRNLPCYGVDFSGDGVVNGTDIAIFNTNLGKANPTAADGDVSGDGVVDNTDLTIIQFVVNAGMTCARRNVISGTSSGIDVTDSGVTIPLNIGIVIPSVDVISPNLECVLNSAAWSTNQSSIGSSVGLSLSAGSGCDLRSVNFTISRKFLLVFKTTVAKISSVKIVSGSASASWNIESGYKSGASYVFDANVGPSSVSSINSLYVSNVQSSFSVRQVSLGSMDYALTRNSNPVNWTYVGAGDFNGDGKKDIYAKSNGESWRVAISNLSAGGVA